MNDLQGNPLLLAAAIAASVGAIWLWWRAWQKHLAGEEWHNVIYSDAFGFGLLCAAAAGWALWTFLGR